MLTSVIRLILIMMLLMTAPLQAAEVYKTVDENGNPVFTDQPSDTAEKIEVKDVLTIPGLKNTAPSASPPAAVDFYQKIAISNPINDGTYFRSEGDIVIVVQVSPRLRGGDEIVYFVDGMRVHADRSTSYSISEMDRGTHTAYATIVDTSGEVLKTSETVTFFVRQASVLSR